MASDSSSLRDSDRRWRFSLRGLLVVMLGCAVGAAAFRWRGSSWSDATTAARTALGVLIAIGLAEQANHLRQTRLAELSPGARWGLLFAWAWRYLIVVLLLSYQMLHYLNITDLLAGEFSVYQADLQFIYYLSMVVVLASVRQQAKRRRLPQIIERLGNGLMWILGAVYCYYILSDYLLITFLVYVAIRGIEVSHSVTGPPYLEGFNPLIVQRAEPAFWLGTCSAALIPLNFLLIYLTSRSSTIVSRSCTQGLFIIAFCAMTSLFLYNCRIALPSAAPLIMQYVIGGGVWLLLLIGTPCWLILATGAAHRWTVAGDDAPATHERMPLGQGTCYLHERPFVLGTLAAVMLVDLIGKVGGSLAWYDLLFFLIMWPTGPVILAVCILSMQKTVAGVRRELIHVPPPELPIRRFLSLWVCLGLTILIAIPVLATWGFSLWLSICFLGTLSTT